MLHPALTISIAFVELIDALTALSITINALLNSTMSSILSQLTDVVVALYKNNINSHTDDSLYLQVRSQKNDETISI
jgi:hypothetical protein